MNYKNVIKSRSMRLKILQALSFIPDKAMLKFQYRMKTGRKLNLDSPSRYTEKLQYYKLYYRDLLMKKCVDKYDVREYVAYCGLSEILVGSIGVYEKVEDIPWNKLPDKYVIKDTLGGGGISVIICKDRNNYDIASIEPQLRSWLNTPTNVKNGGREWPYDGRKHRIYIEEFLPSDEETGGLIDYKFFCFNGKAEYLYVVADRKLGQGAGLGIYTVDDYERLPVLRCDERPLERDVPKPANYEELVEVAEKLAQPFPHARIDLYDVNGQIYFGEITFFDGSGYMMFEPDTFDYEVGEKFKLPEKLIGGGYSEEKVILVYTYCDLQNLEVAA